MHWMGILLIGIWIGVFGGLIIFMLLKHDRR
jgi:hypothetical protein